ncbi:MAG: agmatine deiminase family protein [Pyrinomonadaceae bacterium]
MQERELKPRSLGYTMPAEWEPHAATWLSWPHKSDSWPGKFDPVPRVFAEIVKHLCEHEVVNINVSDDRMEREALRQISASGVTRPEGRVRMHRVLTNDAWARDHGPMFVTRALGDNRREPAIVDWEFNAWGGNTRPTTSTTRCRPESPKFLMCRASRPAS